jgi:SanA protein
MRRWLIQRGVRSGLIVEDHAGFRTLDTMERAARVFGVREAVICTQSFHLPRAVFLARRAGIEATGFGAGGERPWLSAGDAVRESLASVMALLDSYVLNRQPKDARPSPPPSNPFR